MGRASLLCAAVALGLATSAAQADQVRKYNVYAQEGARAGEQVTTFGDDGLVRVKYGYKDNGRGPDYVEEFRLAPDGTFSAFHIKGTSTFGAEVDEQFSAEGGKATWSSRSGRGAQTIAPGTMYLPLNNSFEPESAMLSAAMARGGKLKLVPDGEVSYRKLDEAEVVRDGAKQRVQLLARTGLGFSPGLYWATTGDKPR